MKKNKLNQWCNILLCIILVIIAILCLYLIKQQQLENIEGYAEGDTCTLTLDNINPMFVKNYEQYNNSKINCFNKLTSGFCVNSTLKVIVNPTPTDENGIPIQSEKQSATIVNSNGTTNSGIPEINPWDLPNFFCLKNA